MTRRLPVSGRLLACWPAPSQGDYLKKAAAAGDLAWASTCLKHGVPADPINPEHEVRLPRASTRPQAHLRGRGCNLHACPPCDRLPACVAPPALQSALQLAVANGHLDVAKSILSGGADVNRVRRAGGRAGGRCSVSSGVFLSLRAAPILEHMAPFVCRLRMRLRSAPTTSPPVPLAPRSRDMPPPAPNGRGSSIDFPKTVASTKSQGFPPRSKRSVRGSRGKAAAVNREQKDPRWCAADLRARQAVSATGQP